MRAIIFLFMLVGLFVMLQHSPLDSAKQPVAPVSYSKLR